MWGKIIILMYRLWLHGLYGLYGPRCPLSPKRPLNLISLSCNPVKYHCFAVAVLYIFNVIFLPLTLAFQPGLVIDMTQMCLYLILGFDQHVWVFWWSSVISKATTRISSFTAIYTFSICEDFKTNISHQCRNWDHKDRMVTWLSYL